MDYQKLVDKKDYVQKNFEKIAIDLREKYENDFKLNYNHHSTAIENNTITLKETKLILTGELTNIDKNSREINEIINHNQAFNYIKNCINEEKKLSEDIIKEIHRLLMKNIMMGSVYRMINVFIPGAKYMPPSYDEAQEQLKQFYHKIKESKMNPIELAAYTHTEFLKIHPFIDGNGRTSRLIMNYQLMSYGFLPINIKRVERDEYYDLINEYAISGDLNPFIKFIAAHEEEELDNNIKVIKKQEKATI